jgi:hypothetical protein
MVETVRYRRAHGVLEGSQASIPTFMAKYTVFYFCDECINGHTVTRGLELESGPEERARVANFYLGKELPTPLATILESARCHFSGRQMNNPQKAYLFKQS